MNIRGGIVTLAATLLTVACAQKDLPEAWSVPEHRAYLGVAADDPWCGYMRELRAGVDGVSPAPEPETRDAALLAVEAERDADKDGDPYWPFRKSLICEYVDAAEEELAEFDWVTAAEFLSYARMAETNPAPESGIRPLVPVFDHLGGDEPESLQPVDLTNPAYCDSLETSELALSQQRGEVRDAVGFIGSLRRAPDWFAATQVSYHRWAREQLEGHQTQKGKVDFGGIPFHCRRFFNAFVGAKSFAVKSNLIFLLPERDDPNSAGRLEIRDADGNVVVLDEVLAAAQLNDDGTGGEAIRFFAEDVAASSNLSSALQRLNSLPEPVKFDIFYEKDQVFPTDGDEGSAELVAALSDRGVDEPIRIFMTGHADCVGSTSVNRLISEIRVRNVFESVIKPVLEAQGFTDRDFRDRGKFRLAPRGETKPDAGARCEANPGERRVTVLVQ